MKTLLLVAMIAGGAGASFGAVPNLDDPFDVLYGNGYTFDTPSNGWQSSSAAAMVTNSGAYSAPKAASLSGTVTLTNTLNTSPNLRIWTDLEIKPYIGEQNPTLETNLTSFYSYFTTNGYLSVATPAGFVVCSNDIQGTAVPPATNANSYVRLSVFQDYTSATQAVLLNGQLILQDAAFVAGAPNYSQLLIQNLDSNSCVDDVAVRTNLPSGLGSRALEIQNYGYAARTQYVGGAGYPLFGTITSAVATARSRDTINVASGSYAEDVVVARSVSFTGGAFTNSGSLTLRAGTGVVFQAAMKWGNVLVDSNSLATFNQIVVCSNLTVRAGSTAIVASVVCSNLTIETNAFLSCLSNGTVTCSTLLNCTGVVAVASGATVTVSTALALPPPAHLDFSQGNFVLSPLSVNMTGTFSLSNNWGQGNTVSVPAGASCIFNQVLTNPPLTSLYLYAGGTSIFQTVICTNLTGEDGVRPTFLGVVTCVSNGTLGQTVVATFSNAVTCGKSMTVGTNSSATFTSSLGCSNLIVRSGATVTVASVTCSNVTVETNGRLNCLGAFSCSGVAYFDQGSVGSFSGSVSCPGTLTVATSGGVTLSQGATVGTLNATGTVTVAGQTLNVTTLSVPGSIQVLAGATANVSSSLGLPPSGHMDFTSANFGFTPWAVAMTGTFSLSNNWGQGSAVTVSPYANCTFTQALTNPPLSTVEVGTNATATFNQLVGCSNLTIRSGATVVMSSLTCSNLVVEPGAHFTCSGLLQCSESCAFGQSAIVVLSGSVSCPGTFSVATGATVSLGGTTALGVLNAAGIVTVGAGQTLTATTAAVSGSGAIQLGGSGTLTLSSSLSVTGSGLVTATGGSLNVPASNVDMSGIFSISNTWGTAVTLSLPYAEGFEPYANNTLAMHLGFRGWYASDGTVKVENSVKHTGNNAVVVPDDTILSNSINSAAMTKIWTDFYIQPTLGLEPESPATNSSSFLAYANTNGYLVVAVAGGGWVVCSNRIDGSLATAIPGNAFTRITVCQELVHHTFAVFVAGDLVAQGLIVPANVSSYTAFALNNIFGSAYLDDLTMASGVPAGMTSDRNHNGVPDAVEINNSELSALPLPGTVYLFR